MNKSEARCLPPWAFRIDYSSPVVDHGVLATLRIGHHHDSGFFRRYRRCLSRGSVSTQRCNAIYLVLVDLAAGVPRANETWTNHHRLR